MSWPKPEIVPVKQPIKPRRWIWIMIFILLFVITSLVLATFWSDSDYFRQLTFWVVAILIPLMIWSIALSIRFYLFGLALEGYEIWQQEQREVDHNWQQWAMQHMNVLDSYLVTPNMLSAKEILIDGQNLPVKVNQTLEFSDQEINYTEYLEDLFYSLKSVINSLPQNIQLAITIYSSPDAYDYLDDALRQAYQQSGLRLNYTLTHQIVSSANTEKIIEMIDNPESTLQLIIVNNLQSAGSAFLSALLLAEPQAMAELNHPEVSSIILRPMISQDIPFAIGQMAEMQPEINQIQDLWFGNLEKKQSVDVLKTLSLYQISSKTIYDLDALAGHQTYLAYWSALVLCCQMVKETTQSGLVVTASLNNLLYSVVTKGNEA